MGKWEIEVTRRFEKDFKSLPRDVQERVIVVVESLSKNPYIGSPLRGTPYRKVRVGDYRVIYYVFKEEHKIVLMTIIHRGKGYKWLTRLSVLL